MPAHTGSIRWLDKKSKDVSLTDRFDLELGLLEFRRSFKIERNIHPIKVFMTVMILKLQCR